jgi:hypothetical protein
MTSRCRWVVVRDEKEGKRWQLVFPDGRVLSAIPPDSTRTSSRSDRKPVLDGDAPAAPDDAGEPRY